MNIENLAASNTRLTRRVITLESNSDMAEENYKTLQKDIKDIKDIKDLKDTIEALNDRVKYNHNDMAGLTEQMIELEKDISYLKGMKLVKDTSIWDFFKRK